MASTLATLGRALGRVCTEYKEVARWPGEHDFHVRVEMVGLARHESSQVMGALLAHERVEHVADPVHDDKLAAERRSYIAIDVVKVSNVAAASSLVLDALRGALVDTGLASKVESLKVEAGGC